jgi:hypothetical protein
MVAQHDFVDESTPALSRGSMAGMAPLAFAISGNRRVRTNLELQSFRFAEFIS